MQVNVSGKITYGSQAEVRVCDLIVNSPDGKNSLYKHTRSLPYDGSGQVEANVTVYGKVFQFNHGTGLYTFYSTETLVENVMGGAPEMHAVIGEDSRPTITTTIEFIQEVLLSTVSPGVAESVNAFIELVQIGKKVPGIEEALNAAKQAILLTKGRKDAFEEIFTPIKVYVERAFTKKDTGIDSELSHLHGIIGILTRIVASTSRVDIADPRLSFTYHLRQAEDTQSHLNFEGTDRKPEDYSLAVAQIHRNSVASAMVGNPQPTEEIGQIARSFPSCCIGCPFNCPSEVTEGPHRAQLLINSLRI